MQAESFPSQSLLPFRHNSNNNIRKEQLVIAAARLLAALSRAVIVGLGLKQRLHIAPASEECPKSLWTGKRGTEVLQDEPKLVG